MTRNGFKDMHALKIDSVLNCSGRQVPVQVKQPHIHILLLWKQDIVSIQFNMIDQIVSALPNSIDHGQVIIVRRVGDGKR